MADISKIKLPDGNTYDIVPKAMNIPIVYGDIDFLYPMLVTESLDINPRTSHRSVCMINGGPSISISDGAIKCKMYVEDISTQYTPSKTGGNWSIGSDDGIYRIKAYRMGSLIQIAIAFHGNGTAVSAGSNGFVGAITDGALPIEQITLTGFYSNSMLAATLDTDGSITVRPFGASCTLSNASRAYLTGTFITNN